MYNHGNRKHRYQWRSKALQPPDHAAESVPAAASSSWSVSGTSQWQYPTDVIVSTAPDLLHLQQFLVGKVSHVCGVQRSAWVEIYRPGPFSPKIFVAVNLD